MHGRKVHKQVCLCVVVCVRQGFTQRSEQVSEHVSDVMDFCLLSGVCDHHVRQFYKAVLTSRSKLHIFEDCCLLFTLQSMKDLKLYSIIFLLQGIFFRLLRNVPVNCVYRSRSDAYHLTSFESVS